MRVDELIIINIAVNLTPTLKLVLRLINSCVENIANTVRKGPIEHSSTNNINPVAKRIVVSVMNAEERKFDGFGGSESEE